MPTMFKVDALEVKVRGFRSKQAGLKVAEVLSSLGFKLKDFSDGSLLDGSMHKEGGLIETEVMVFDCLYADSLDEINKALCFSPEIVVWNRQFAIVQGWTNQTGASAR